MPKSTERYSFLSSYVRGEVLSGGWTVLNKVVAGINAFIVLSHLEVFTYGVYVLIFAFVSLVTGLFQKPFADVVQNDIARFIGEKKEAEAKKLFLENLVVRATVALLLSLATFFGADIIARYYDQDIGMLFRILSPIFILDVLTLTPRTLFELRLRFGEPALRPVIYNSIKLLLLGGAIAFYHLGLIEFLVIYLIATFLGLFVFLPRIRELYAPWAAIRAAKGSQLLPLVLGHGKWRAMSQALSSASSNIRPWLIHFFINTEAVAIYSVAESLFGALKTLLPSNTFVTLIPREVAANEERAVRVLIRGTKYLVITGFVFAAGGLLFVPPLVKLIVPSYVPSLPYFTLLLTILPLMGISSIATYFLFALQKQRFMFFVNLARIPLSWVFPAVLLYFFGLWGMPFERILISLLVSGVYFSYLLRYHVPKAALRLLFIFDATDRELLKRAWKHLSAALIHRLERLPFRQ